MPAKKLLSAILLERTESIQYRKVRSQLMNMAQNEKREFFILKLDEYTTNRLQNEGIAIETDNTFNYSRLKLTW